MTGTGNQVLEKAWKNSFGYNADMDEENGKLYNRISDCYRLEKSKGGAA